MFLDPTLINWLLIGGASICAFMVGRISNDTTDQVINDTIMYLIENNFVRARKIDGEWDILPLDHEK